MELFKKKTATDKAIDLLTNALHNDEISSYIVLVKKQKNTVVIVNGDLFSQAASLVTARRKEVWRRIEGLAADILNSFTVGDNSIRMGVANKPDDEGRYALLYWKYAEKGGAR